jgi:hypothetical protein
VLRKIFGPKKDRSTGLWERRTDLELRELFSEADIVATLKSKRISWAGHIWRAQDQITGEATKWIPNGKRPLGRPRQRWVDRVKSDLQMLGVINGEELAIITEKHGEMW